MVSQASVLPPSISLTVFGVCKEHGRIEKYTEKRDVIRNVISLLWRSRRHPAVERALGVQRATAGCVSVCVCVCVEHVQCFPEQKSRQIGRWE